MAAGSKVEDDKQEYQYSMPFISPSGHELSFYETPDNQRVVLRHTSGSHIEFKSDGSVRSNGGLRGISCAFQVVDHLFVVHLVQHVGRHHILSLLLCLVGDHPLSGR